MQDQVNLLREIGATGSAMAHMWDHVCDQPNVEICGIITSRGQYTACNNLSNDPANHFVLEASPEQIDDAIAIVHSHPNESMAVLSASDMDHSIRLEKPYVVLARDSNNNRDMTVYNGPRQPLLGRSFRHGSSDCYTCVIDWYAENRGIKLKDHPRDWRWWSNGLDLYKDGFPETGFRSIFGFDDLKVGDLVLARLLSKVHNHAAVYVGNNLIYHQMGGKIPVDPSRMAAREPMTRFMGFLDKTLILRHESTD